MHGICKTIWSRFIWSRFLIYLQYNTIRIYFWQWSVADIYRAYTLAPFSRRISSVWIFINCLVFGFFFTLQNPFYNIQHPDFNFYLPNDAALLELSQPVVENHYVRIAMLPTRCHDFTAQDCIAIGWGKTQGNRLMCPAGLQPLICFGIILKIRKYFLLVYKFEGSQNTESHCLPAYFDKLQLSMFVSESQCSMTLYHTHISKVKVTTHAQQIGVFLYQKVTFQYTLRSILC